MMRFLFLCSSLCYASVHPVADSTAERSPINVRLALYGTAKEFQNGMTVSWEIESKTKGDCPEKAFVRFGTSQEQINGEVSSNEYVQYTVAEYVSNCIYHATILPNYLTPNTLYFYQCGSSLGFSKVMTFTTPLPVGSKEPMKIVLMGDLGTTINSQKTVQYISEEKSVTAIFLAGDLSYANGDQPVWEDWLDMVQPLISRYPMMVIAGNHEEEQLRDPAVDKFIAYQSLLRMPYPPTSKDGNLYYGMRLGMVHLIAITPYISSKKGSPQYDWLIKELASVDRNITPWLIVMTHAPFYQSNMLHQERDGSEPQYDMKANLEQLLYENKVDIFVNGHVHAFELTKTVYQGEVVNDGPVYLTIGDGGNKEGLAKDFMNPAPKWSLYREALYGYSTLNVTLSELKLDWYVHTGTNELLLKKSFVLTKNG